jgi:hypothetical protein
MQDDTSCASEEAHKTNYDDTYRIYSKTALILINRDGGPSGCGPGSSVGIATGYGLDGPGIELAASVV